MSKNTKNIKDDKKEETKTTPLAEVKEEKAAAPVTTVSKEEPKSPSATDIKEEPKSNPEVTSSEREPKETTEEPTRFSYVGPSAPQYGLVQNQTFVGTKKQVEEHLAAAIKITPQVKNLVVETKNLAESMKKVKEPGNALNQQYVETRSILRKRIQEGDNA